eukprot:363563-Chlamydomonas_euryale.AAC.12
MGQYGWRPYGAVWEGPYGAVWGGTGGAVWGSMGGGRMGRYEAEWVGAGGSGGPAARVAGHKRKVPAMRTEMTLHVRPRRRASQSPGAPMRCGCRATTAGRLRRKGRHPAAPVQPGKGGGKGYEGGGRKGAGGSGDLRQWRRLTGSSLGGAQTRNLNDRDDHTQDGT